MTQRRFRKLLMANGFSPKDIDKQVKSFISTNQFYTDVCFTYFDWFKFILEEMKNV